eukprot:21890_1
MTLAILCIAIVLIITSGQSIPFTCIDNQCSCLNGECSHTCSSHQCNNTYFICPSSAVSCLIDCNGRESCKHSKLLGAAASVVLNCNGADSCTGIQVSCGVQDILPTALASSYATNEFTGTVSDCFVNLLTPNAMSDADISCAGSIANCVVDAYADHSISTTSFECNTDVNPRGNGCQLNCLEPTSCNSMEYVCNSPWCSCGLLDRNCANEAITLRRNTLHDTTRTDEYNCMDLATTEVEIRSMARPRRDSTFHYEISGKDAQHQTILFRYKSDAFGAALSSSSHGIHRSVYFSEHEEYGKTYEFEWTFNEPKRICWLTQQLSAVKIDLFYNKNISFAFTYIYSEDMVRKPSGQWMLTAKNNWNLGVTYLENGFLSFDYEYNVRLSYPLTMHPTTEHTTSPTREPTHSSSSVVQVSPEQTTTNDSPKTIKYDAQTETETATEREVMESTRRERDVMDSELAPIKGNTDTPIKGLLFGIALTALCSICCIIGCIAYNKKKQTQRMAAAYASADAMDSDDDAAHASGDQGDIDEEENDIESGIVDENDLTAQSHVQAGAIKKYKTLDPRKILASRLLQHAHKRQWSQSKSASESGIGYIAESKRIGNASDDDHGLSDDESLLVGDAEISMDAEYHHVIADISLMNDHVSHTTLGFEAGSMLQHYVNQDSTFELDEKKEVSVSQSMSRLSQSLSIPPIELDRNITNVKTLKSKTSIQSATDSMKKFSEKIANCAATFGHDASRATNNDDQFATIVIYKNSNASTLPQSQIVQSTTPPPIPMLNGVDVFMEPQSTQTMIVKHNKCTSKSFDPHTQMSQIQLADPDPNVLLCDVSSDSSDDISNSPKVDPIDASEDDEVIGDPSHHDRRTMVISDDLNIHHLMDDD